MNNIIPQKDKNKRYLPHEIKTRCISVNDMKQAYLLKNQN